MSLGKDLYLNVKQPLLEKTYIFLLTEKTTDQEKREAGSLTVQAADWLIDLHYKTYLFATL